MLQLGVHVQVTLALRSVTVHSFVKTVRFVVYT